MGRGIGYSPIHTLPPTSCADAQPPTNGADSGTPRKANQKESIPNMQEALLLLRNLADSKFYGTLVIKLEAGKVVLLRKKETIKPTYYGSNRGDNNGSDD
jgi:hypothetical protein